MVASTKTCHQSIFSRQTEPTSKGFCQSLLNSGIFFGWNFRRHVYPLAMSRGSSRGPRVGEKNLISIRIHHVLKVQSYPQNIASWWFQNISQSGNLPQFLGENEKYLKPPTR